ncbi:hypothetical protein DH2020_048912 [Rehmannia glutinosa]|uniref:Retrotransposon gag domain-containing protein n=1 Tax=Rehmannia glutinosa TaxID=99300 RepID=A0ABR0U4A5_REHGL
MILLRHHLHESLKNQYLTVKSPLELWKSLKDRFDHQKTVILPRARYEWMQLRLQDFKTVSDYNSSMFRIVSKLRLCGETVTDEDMLEKTYSTFHASNVILQQQYRQKGFTTYSQLISCLLVAEENNDLLMQNHQARPTGSAPLHDLNSTFPEVNNISSSRGHGRGRGPTRGRGRGRGRGRSVGHNNTWMNPNFHGNKGKSPNKNNPLKVSTPNYETACYRCGMTDIGLDTAVTAPHLVKLYLASKEKEKGKGVETNFIEGEGYEKTHLDASDFFEDPDKNLPNFGLNPLDFPTTGMEFID